MAIIFIIAYLVEHIFPQRRDLTDYYHDLINILVGLGDLIIVGLGGYFLQWLLTYLHHCHFGLLYFLPVWAQIISGLLLADLFMYWWHRANHIFPAFWYFHRFHHRDTKLNVTSSVRFHAGELLLSYVIKIPVFALLGISATTVALYGFILLPVITLHHSNIRIGTIPDKIIRIFFVSPRMHRIHHSVIRQETNSNYSSVLPYWDMLFGSYLPVPAKPIEFGI
ncbi:MAG: sterol desaturase family protein [Taibaiella sp.]|nr:sterol desaturase family protein [Taibaiella sp.]